MTASSILWYSLLTSITGIFATAFFQGNWVLHVAVGVAPMAFYFTNLFRKNSLTQVEIDSIYYFGFLVTLCSLGAAVIELSLKGLSGDNTDLIARFGLGLFATGLGLMGRLLLLPKKTSIDSTDEALDKQLQQVASLVMQFQTTIDLFKELRQEALDETVKGVSNASSAALTAISDGLKEPIALVDQKLNELASTFSSFDTAGLNSLSRNTGALSKSFANLSAVTPQISATLVDIGATAKTAQEAYTKLNSSLASVTENTAQLAIAMSNFTDIPQVTEKIKKALEELSSHLGSIKSQNFETLNSNIAAISEAFQSLATSAQVSKTAIANTSDLTVQKLSGLSQSLQDNATALKLSASSLSEAMTKLSSALRISVNNILS